MIDWAWLIPIIPYLAIPLILFFGKKTPEEGAYIAISFVGVSFILAISTAFQVIFGGLKHGSKLFKYYWIPIKEANLPLTVVVDPLSVFMTFLVTLIATLVLIFSLGYMHGEEGLARYYAEMSLFVGSMLTIVMAGDLLTLFIGWELVGLSSYLLIGFWYKRPLAASAAKKAFLTTKFGDIFMMIGIALIYANTTPHTLILEEINKIIPGLRDLTLITLIGIFLFMGAMGKSAQGFLMPWLWDAMEGPTTVSAILHSSTMVKAGVYLVARIYPIVISSQTTMLFVAYVGGITAFVAATFALVEFDIKRILAYSTISQIGYMMLALGIGAFGAGLFHLLSHATFKALLFLAAGSVVHAMHEIVHDPYLSRDLRYMGGLGKYMKITSITMLIGALSLSGIPPFSGFFSKDLVIEMALESGDSLLFWLATLTALLTAFYIFRLWIYAFRGELRAPKLLREHGHEIEGEIKIRESPGVMTGPLIVLSILTIIVGFFGSPWFGAPFIKFVGKSLEPYHLEVELNGLVRGVHFEAYTTFGLVEISTILLSPMVLGFVAFGIFLAWGAFDKGFISTEFVVKNPILRGISKLLEKRLYFDDLYVFIGEKLTWKGISRGLSLFDEKVVDGIVNAVGYAGIYLAKLSDWIDVHIVDGIVNGIGKLSMWIGDKLRRLNIGIVQFYVFLVGVGLIIVIVLGLYHSTIAPLFKFG